jgi:hypothetical protein
VLALVALLVGAVVAGLGITAAVRSMLEDRDIEDYSDARRTAKYFVDNGRTISRSMRRLAVLDDRDVVTMEKTRAAESEGDTLTYNLLTQTANMRNVEQQAMMAQVKRFQRGFREVYAEYRAQQE